MIDLDYGTGSGPIRQARAEIRPGTLAIAGFGALVLTLVPARMDITGNTPRVILGEAVAAQRSAEERLPRRFPDAIQRRNRIVAKQAIMVRTQLDGLRTLTGKFFGWMWETEINRIANNRKLVSWLPFRAVFRLNQKQRIEK